uniref:Uncharacterized protein n=1 Tax=Pseudomonas phage PMBT23 TaxID=3137284 RepID=A0AAU8BWC6_9VIRU
MLIDQPERSNFGSVDTLPHWTVRSTLMVSLMVFS